jgi:Holliday junction resolvase
VRWARRIDVSHVPIRDALRKHWPVEDTARAGSGFPDLIVHHAGRVVLVECKQARNKAGTVTESRVEASQVDFAGRWRGGPIVTATSPDQAVAAVLEALRGRE